MIHLDEAGRHLQSGRALSKIPTIEQERAIVSVNSSPTKTEALLPVRHALRSRPRMGCPVLAASEGCHTRLP